MARTSQYTEDQLLDSVVKYSEIEHGKIKITELTKWCRENVEGLEEVTRFQFTRNIQEKNPKTGKVTEHPRPCALKIEEINKARSITTRVNTNLLLKASNIDTFFSQPASVQRKMVVETREIVDKLTMRNVQLERENKAARIQTKEMKKTVDDLSEKISDIQTALNKLSKQVTFVMKISNDEMKKKMLAEMGIEDGKIDLAKYTDSLQVTLDQAMNINRSVQKAINGEIAAEPVKTMEDTKETEEDTDHLANDILSGIDF